MTLTYRHFPNVMARLVRAMTIIEYGGFIADWYECE
jgi:hypothetical protein